MRIKSITLENFRSYSKAITIKDLSDVNIFIGPNNVGKSNILEALRYIQALADGKKLRDYREMVFNGRIKLNIHLTFTFSLSTEERKDIINELFQGNSHATPEKVRESAFLSTLIYDVVLENRGLVQDDIKVSNVLDGNLTIIRNSIVRNSWTTESLNLADECKQLVAVENIKPTLASKGTRSPAPEGRVMLEPGISPTPAEYRFLNKIREFTRRWRWFQPIRDAAPRMTPAEQSQLDSRGANLVQFLFSLQNNDPDEFVRLKNEIPKILPHLQGVLAPLRGKEAAVAIRENGLDLPIDLSNVSSGLHQVLILVFGIMSINPGSTVLIEEPELHLHAASQRKLFNLIQKEAEQKQFFITTHSSVFTGCSDQVSTYLVTKRDGATSVKKIEESSELRQIKNALGHRNTDLFGHECVVFIEGDSEESAFPIIAEALGYDLVEMGIRLTNIRGKGKVSKIAEYLGYLKDSDVLPYVIADGDKQVKQRLRDWVREGLLQKDCGTVWSLEFEDCFEPHRVITAMEKLAEQNGSKFDVTLADLEENRPKGKSVVKALEKLLYENKLPSLDKPSLSETLAFRLKEEIENTPPEKRKKTPPEQVIEKIVKLVEERWKEKTV